MSAVPAAAVFAALGDEVRLRLVTRLADAGPQSITQLTEGTSITRQAVTKHLEVLAGAGVVTDRRTGRERLWSVERRELERVQGHLTRISQQWDAAIERLRSQVEG